MFARNSLKNKYYNNSTIVIDTQNYFVLQPDFSFIFELASLNPVNR